jgi:hypothetical protein
MKLRDFVSEALADIVGGVQDAQGKTPAGVVVPYGMSTKMDVIEAGVTQFQVVDFEVTVKADEKSGRESGLAISLAIHTLWPGVLELVVRPSRAHTS